MSLLLLFITLYLQTTTTTCFVADLKNKTMEYENLFKYILYAQKNNLNVYFANTSMPFIWENVTSECTNATLIDESKLTKYDYRQHCLLKIRKDAHKQFQPQTVSTKRSLKSTKLAIGVPVSSRGIPYIQYLPLFTNLLPSLLSKGVEFHLMVAFDEGDYFFDNLHYQYNYILKELDRIGISFEVYKFPRFKALNFLWNWMFHRAFLYNFNHFFQVNDDAVLSDFDYNPELLLTGPFDPDLPYIFTQALVNIEAHNELANGTLYPSEFLNWGGDLWLTRLYKSSCRFIGNVTNARQHSCKARYQPCR